MNLKVSNVNFCGSKITKPGSQILENKYTGIPNFNPRYTLNPKQSFMTKIYKFIRALYYANFK